MGRWHRDPRACTATVGRPAPVVAGTMPTRARSSRFAGRASRQAALHVADTSRPLPAFCRESGTRLSAQTVPPSGWLVVPVRSAENRRVSQYRAWPVLCRLLAASQKEIWRSFRNLRNGHRHREVVSWLFFGSYPPRAHRSIFFAQLTYAVGASANRGLQLRSISIPCRKSKHYVCKQTVQPAGRAVFTLETPPHSKWSGWCHHTISLIVMAGNNTLRAGKRAGNADYVAVCYCRCRTGTKAASESVVMFVCSSLNPAALPSLMPSSQVVCKRLICQIL